MNVSSCPTCGHENPTGSKFCNECGTKLPSRCPSCGSENPVGSKFCNECGTRLDGASALTTPGSQPAVLQPAEPAPVVSAIPQTTNSAGGAKPAAERRLVTVLFCDLVGSTPLAERLDPEEVRDMLAAYFGAMNAQIERYGGAVEKYAGDGILALFGAVQAHEDDAERAVLCGLGMQAAIEPVAEKARERWDVEPRIRVGINTGEVVRGTWEAPGWQDVAVTGDVINTAARIQGAGEPGEVLVGEETMRLTRRRIHFGERRELVLKGKAGTVPIYPALSVRERFGERWETSDGAAPLIGRDREMVRLLDAWVRAQGSEGQLVSVVGDAGVGKSRLISELLERIGTTSAIRVIRARCLSYGQEIALWLVSDLLRSLFGIAEQDGIDDVRTKLGVAVGALLRGQNDDTRSEALDVLGEVLGLPAGGSMVANAGAQIRRQALIRSIRLALAATADRAPSALILEDLHWSDEASGEVLRAVLADVPGLRLLVLAAQRPGWAAPWSEWGWIERITLRPLREEEAAELASAVLGAPVSVDLAGYVAERAGGNPFFVEEMLRALSDAGDLQERGGTVSLATGAAERLPSTLTEVLLARLDRLDEDVRNVAQVASVIGRSFGVPLLAEVMGQAPPTLEPVLAALQQAEIAFPRRGSDREYVFKHVSMREVAYNTLLQKRRQALHLQTARAIAALYSSDEYVEMIAFHYSRTEEHAEAAQWLERAGDQAADVYANETAIANYGEARRRWELVGAAVPEIARLDEKRGRTLYVAARFDEAALALQAAVEAYRSAHDLEGAGRAAAHLGRVLSRRGDTRESQAVVEPMIAALTERGPSAALADLHITLSMVLQSLGEYEEFLIEAERATEIAESIGDDLLAAQALERRGGALNFLGRIDESRRALEEAIPRLEAVGELSRLHVALSNLGNSALMAGDLERARDLVERSLQTALRAGDLASASFSSLNVGQIHIAAGRWDEGLESLDRAHHLLDDVNPEFTIAYIHLLRGMALLGRGDWADAKRELVEGLAFGEQFEDRQAIEYGSVALAELTILTGQPDEAVRRLEPLAEREGGELVPIRLTLAWALADLDELDRALALSEDAISHGRAQQEILRLIDALRVRGMILGRLRRFEEAQLALDEALALAGSTGAAYAEARIREQIGLILEAQTRLDKARTALDQAREIFQRLGAQKDIERLDRELSNGAGIAPHAQSATNSRSLGL